MRKVVKLAIGVLSAGAFVAACEGTYGGYYGVGPVYGGAYGAYPYEPYYYGYGPVPGYQLGYARPYGAFPDARWEEERHEELERLQNQAFKHDQRAGQTPVRPPEHSRF
jgi:hypothetical protein